MNTTDLHETFNFFELDDIQLKGKTVPVKKPAQPFCYQILILLSQSYSLVLNGCETLILIITYSCKKIFQMKLTIFAELNRFSIREAGYF